MDNMRFKLYELQNNDTGILPKKNIESNDNVDGNTTASTEKKNICL